MLLLIDKPKGITSHDVVDKIRKITSTRKVGHGGTLDPNATGLLIVGVGKVGTKQLGNISKNTTKEYIGELFLGKTTDTDDSEGKVTSENKVIVPTKQDILKVLESIKGEIEQIPPAFSAIKLNGKKAYELARKGKEVKLAARKVTIHEAELVSYNYPLLECRFLVSSGTYIRALARDMGQLLGCGAYLSNLRRTKIDSYDIKDALTLEGLEEKLKKTNSLPLE